MNKSILLIHDNDIARAEISSMLKLEGFDVIDSKSGSEMLEPTFYKLFDIVICDAELKIMNIIEYLRILRAKNILHDGVKIMLAIDPLSTDVLTLNFNSGIQLINNPIMVEDIMRQLS